VASMSINTVNIPQPQTPYNAANFLDRPNGIPAGRDRLPVQQRVEIRDWLQKPCRIDTTQVKYLGHAQSPVLTVEDTLIIIEHAG